MLEAIDEAAREGGAPPGHKGGNSDMPIVSDALDALLADMIAAELDVPSPSMAAAMDEQVAIDDPFGEKIDGQMDEEPADQPMLDDGQWDSFFFEAAALKDTELPDWAPDAQAAMQPPAKQARQADAPVKPAAVPTPAASSVAEPEPRPAVATHATVARQGCATLAGQTATEPKPARVYSAADLALFERLTGYRLVVQRQLWRSVDNQGNRAMAGDRLFTVLAEEAFQLADRQRRNGPNPQHDLTVSDIAAAMPPMRSIASHLGERGLQASDRLEAVLMAALDQRVAA